MDKTKIGAYPTATDIETADFLDGGCKDTAFMRSNGISIVYTPGVVVILTWWSKK